MTDMGNRLGSPHGKLRVIKRIVMGRIAFAWLLRLADRSLLVAEESYLPEKQAHSLATFGVDDWPCNSHFQCLILRVTVFQQIRKVACPFVHDKRKIRNQPKVK